MEKAEIDYYLDETIKSLITHDPIEIILFGSISKGVYNDDSDIDLLIILDIDEIPSSYEEKMILKMNLRKSIRSINRKIPIDLLVYTKKEYEVIKKEKSAFFEEINQNGKIVYEKAS